MESFALSRSPEKINFMQTHMTKALSRHVIAVYDAMDKEAVEHDGHRLFIGSLATLVRSIASSTFYAPILRALYDGGYAALVDRGGRDKPSTVVLLRRPQADELMALTMATESPILPLLNRVESLESSIGGMFVAGAMIEIDRRLARIEQRLGLNAETEVS
jgi:hypothetical protein